LKKNVQNGSIPDWFIISNILFEIIYSSRVPTSINSDFLSKKEYIVF
jgi:hypothetical protein